MVHLWNESGQVDEQIVTVRIRLYKLSNKCKSVKWYSLGLQYDYFFFLMRTLIGFVFLLIMSNKYNVSVFFFRWLNKKIFFFSFTSIKRARPVLLS